MKMIRWCSYCQRMIGESQPFEVFEFSHGICSQCRKNKRYTRESEKGVKELAQFFNEVMKIARTGDMTLAPAALKKAQSLGMRPIDFLVGMIQPSLYQIGSLWEHGKITVEDEHRFTAFASRVIDLCEQQLPFKQFNEPEFLLLAAPGNYHVLGVKLVEQLLLSCNRSTYTVFPGIPLDEIEPLVNRLKPKYVGISFSTTEQAQALPEILNILTDTKVIVGGSALRRKGWHNLEKENVSYLTEFSMLELLCQRR